MKAIRSTLISVDTETTGTGFDDRPVGLSYCADGGQREYLRWGHEGGENNCTIDRVQYWASRELNRPENTLVFHHAGFDMRMCEYVGIKLDKPRIEDTGYVAALLNELDPSFALEDQIAQHLNRHKKDDELNQYCADAFGGKPTRRGQAGNYWRAPGDIVEPYAIGDAVDTLDLWRLRRPLLSGEELDGVYEDELALIPILLRMHMVGVKANVRAAKQLKLELTARRELLRARWNTLAGPGVKYNSSKQLAKVFDNHGYTYPFTELGNPSFEKDWMQYQTHEVAKVIMELKQLDHFIGTFIDSYVLNNVDKDGFIHGEFHPLRGDRYGTVSGRFSSGGALNLQNVPARDEVLAPMVRGMYIPCSPDHDWLKADYSQIEYRFLAHYAGGQLAREYNEDPDVDFHEMCSQLVGIPRRPAKNINFGIVYGMGEALMASKLGVGLDEAREMLLEYHTRLPEVKRIYNQADRRAKRRGFIRTWGGRKRRFRKKRSYYMSTHKALNALLQGSAADLLKRAMAKVVNEGIVDWENVVLHLTVHDELDFSVPKGAMGKWAYKQIKECMEDFKITVPIRADLGVGPDWGHCEKEAA